MVASDHNDHDLREEIHQLKYAQQRLLDSNSALSNFAHAASHDLKAPLRSLSFYHSLIRKRVDNNDGEIEKYLDDVDDIVKRMGIFIDGLLDYAELTKAVRLDEEVDVNVLIQGIIKNFKADIEGKKAVITVANLPVITGNTVLIQQLFHNIIGNAFKYCSKDGPAPEININGKVLDNFWQFSICDNGIGIDQRHHEKIFQAFQRLHHRAEYEGLGIGLDLCRKVIDQHQGQIWVESELGKGSNFQFTLRKNIAIAHSFSSG